MKTERGIEPTQPLPSDASAGFSLFFQKYGTRLLVFITLIALAFAIFRYRSATTQRRLSGAQNSLTQARGELMQLQELLQIPAADPEPIAMRRNQLFAQTLSDLSEVAADAGDDHPVLMAEYFATQGDLFWTMANAPDYPQATTRPSMAMPHAPDDLLHNSEVAYQQITARYTNQPIAWATAELGLAAIAENRHDWGQAARSYQAVQASESAADVFKDIARERMLLLKNLENPVQLGALTTQPSTPPSTQSSTQPSTQPSAESSTQMSTTLPSTQAMISVSTSPTSMPAH